MKVGERARRGECYVAVEGGRSGWISNIERGREGEKHPRRMKVATGVVRGCEKRGKVECIEAAGVDTGGKGR